MDLKWITRDHYYGAAQDRPDMHSLLIPGRRGRLFAGLYTAGGPGPHPTVLMLHGIPGNERNFDLAQALRRVGFHVMVFHYSGSWGSDGDYSITGDLEDANTVLDYLLADRQFGIDKERIFAVGHSLGGFVCGQLTATRPEIRAGVLLTPCDIGRIRQIRKEDPATADILEYVLQESAPWLRGTSKEALLAELEEKGEEFRLESAAARLAEKPLLVVEGTLDPYTPPRYHCAPLEAAIAAAGGTKLRRRELETDHFAADCRITLAEITAEFLLDCL